MYVNLYVHSESIHICASNSRRRTEWRRDFRENQQTQSTLDLDELVSACTPLPLTKEIRIKIFDPIISNSFPVRYYGISSTNLPDIP